MQKNNKASILIWAFFLTLFMSFSFIFIQFQIKSSFSKNSEKLKKLEINKQKQEFLGNINSKTKKIGENNLIIRDFDSLEYTLKKDKTLNLNFIEDGIINLELLNSGIISYATGTNKLGKNILPTYNTGTTFTGFTISSHETLKIKNFSGYSKIRIGAKKIKNAYINNIGGTYTYDNFKKSGKVTISLGYRSKFFGGKMNHTGSKIEYSTQYSGNGTIVNDGTTKTKNKSFFIKAGDKLTITNKNTNSYPFSNKVNFTISADYNLSDMLKNNTYKITKTSWGKEIVIEKGKIK